VASEETAKSNTALIVGSIVTIIVALIASPIWGPPACRAVHICPQSPPPPPTPQTLQASPTTLPFGPVQVEHASTTADVTIINPGPNAASVTVSVTGHNAADFNILADTCSSGRLPRGTQCTVTLDFVPKAEDERFATLALQANGADVSPSVGLRGTGTPPGAISFAPPDVFFNLTWLLGTNPAPTSRPMPITVTNTGSGAVTIGKISIDDTEHFSVSADCDGRTLAAGRWCQVTLTFVEDGTGRLSATMIVTDDAPDSPQYLPLAGNRGQVFPIIHFSLSPSPTTTAAR
jgi:large repetitive protein